MPSIVLILLCILGFPKPPKAALYNYESTRALVDSLITAHPLICKKVSLGNSVQSREIYAVKISDSVELDQTEPEVLFDAGIHGDEIPGEEMVIRFMRDLCTGYGSDSQITRLIHSREIYIIPYINPDGRVNNTRGNSNGVNLNRDFGYMWANTQGSTRPFSQPESRIYMNFWLERNFSFTWSNHDPFKQIAYSWGFRPQKSFMDPLLDTLSRNCAALSNNYYTHNGPTYNVMYQITGGAMDYHLGTRGVPSWMVEVFSSKTPSSETVLDPIYAFNRTMMLYLLNKVAQGIGGKITNKNGQAVAARMIFSNNGISHYPIYNSPGIGDFFKTLLPGEYAVKIMAQGYADTLISALTVNKDSATSLNVVLDSLASDKVAAQAVMLAVVPRMATPFSLTDELYTPGALGRPDGIAYSLGSGGYIVLDMGKTLNNVAGKDFTIFGTQTLPQNISVRVSTNWLTPVNSWPLIGNTAGTDSFDVSAANVSTYRYVMIQDDNDDTDPYADDAGFDLDAIEANLGPLDSSSSAPGGLIGWWALNENNGTLAGDSAPNPISGTLSGAVWTTGKMGSSLSFDGGDELVIPGHDKLNFGTADFTIALWIKPAMLTARMGILDRSDGTTGYRLTVSDTDPGRLKFIRGYLWSEGIQSDSGIITPGIWNHVACVVSRGEATFFINGLPHGSGILAGKSATTSSNLHVGKKAVTGSTMTDFNGQIDELRLYNAALSEQEITALVSSGNLGRELCTGIRWKEESSFSVYPNPFNPTTRISFSLPSRENVTISIFGIKGELIEKIIDDKSLAAGTHTLVWPSRTLNKTRSSTYIAVLKTNKKTKAIPLLLLK